MYFFLKLINAKGIMANWFASFPSNLCSFQILKFFFYCNSSVCTMRSMHTSSVEVQTNVYDIFFLFLISFTHMLNTWNPFFVLYSSYNSLISTFGFLIECEEKKCRQKWFMATGGIIGWKNAIYYNSPSFFCVENIMLFDSPFIQLRFLSRNIEKKLKERRRIGSGISQTNDKKNGSSMNGKTSLSAIIIRI